jgi:hypothetical protein
MTAALAARDRAAAYVAPICAAVKAGDRATAERLRDEQRPHLDDYKRLRAATCDDCGQEHVSCRCGAPA